MTQPRTSIQVELVKDAIGGYQMVTKDNPVIENVYVKEGSRIPGSVQHVTLEIIYVIKDSGINW